MMSIFDELDRAVGAIHTNRRIIVTTDVSAGVTRIVSDLRRWGAADVLVVAGSAGVGPQPECDVVNVAMPDLPTLSQRLQALETILLHPPTDLVVKVDDFDPDRSALVITPPFNRAPGTLGRRTLGARPEPWRLLEDKTTVDELWRAAGLTAAPSATVAPADAPREARLMASHLGTVWAADNRFGWHGAVDGTEWVADESEMNAAVDRFAGHDLVRVMPFLDGIPCSIHGIVTNEGVVVTRPAEILILRDLARHAFLYAGVATCWDPGDRVRSEMRESARMVGRYLSDQFDYRGAFGIDGVVTQDGFLPTELNPRFTGGLARIAASIEDLAIDAVDRAIVDGDLVPAVVEFESELVKAADHHRSRTAGLMVPLERDKASFGLDWAGGRLVDSDRADAGLVEIGPLSHASYIRITFEPRHTPTGSSLAGPTVEAIRLASRIWGLELPELSAAPEL